MTLGTTISNFFRKKKYYKLNLYWDDLDNYYKEKNVKKLIPPKNFSYNGRKLNTKDLTLFWNDEIDENEMSWFLVDPSRSLYDLEIGNFIVIKYEKIYYLGEIITKDCYNGITVKIKKDDNQFKIIDLSSFEVSYFGYLIYKEERIEENFYYYVRKDKDLKTILIFITSKSFFDSTGRLGICNSEEFYNFTKNTLEPVGITEFAECIYKVDLEIYSNIKKVIKFFNKNLSNFEWNSEIISSI